MENRTEIPFRSPRGLAELGIQRGLVACVDVAQGFNMQIDAGVDGGGWCLTRSRGTSDVSNRHRASLGGQKFSKEAGLDAYGPRLRRLKWMNWGMVSWSILAAQVLLARSVVGRQFLVQKRKKKCEK